MDKSESNNDNMKPAGPSFLSKLNFFVKNVFKQIHSAVFDAAHFEGELSNLQKTAVFFLTLPPEATARLINSLSSNEIRNITTEMRQLSYVTPTAQKEVIREFCEFLLEEGKLPDGANPTREAVNHIADNDPKGTMGVLRRHWLAPHASLSTQREAAEKAKPEEKAAVILTHLPSAVLRKILPLLSPEEVGRLGKGMIQISSLPEETQHHMWSGLSRWFRGNLEDQESLVKGIHQLLQEDRIPEYPPLDPPEKAAMLLRLLKPKETKEIGQKFLELLDRPEQESLILALRQAAQEYPEKEKNKVMEDFFSFVKCSLISQGALREDELMEEVEHLGLRMPREVAGCLELEWLTRKNRLNEWREMAEKHASFAAQKLAAFLQLKGRKLEPLSSFQKAALLLRLIHPEIRAEILKGFRDEILELLTYEIEKTWRVTPEEKRIVLEEFLGQYYFHSTAKLLEKNNNGN